MWDHNFGFGCFISLNRDYGLGVRAPLMDHKINLVGCEMTKDRKAEKNLFLQHKIVYLFQTLLQFIAFL